MAAGRTYGPAQEDIASRLHEAVSVHDPLSMVTEDAVSGISLQHRTPSFFELQEKWIAAARQKEQNPAPCANATDAYDLDCDISQLIMIQQQPAVRFQGALVSGKSRTNFG